MKRKFIKVCLFILMSFTILLFNISKVEAITYFDGIPKFIQRDVGTYYDGYYIEYYKPDKKVIIRFL